MLLEEALAGNNSNYNDNNANPTATSGSISNMPLSPHDEALAILSFIRDELPAGGTAAEKRFVNLFLLIVNRVFGPWNIPPSEGSPGRSPLSPSNGGGRIRSPVTSPGGSIYSSPASSSPSGERDHRHAEGGWLSLSLSPSSQPQRAGNNNTPTSSSRTSLDGDPIVRLLRAPRKRTSNAGTNNYYAPTLIDALSAETIHRPSVRFKFPLAGLSSIVMQPLADDWKVCFWNEFEREAAAQMAATASPTSRGGFGSLPGGSRGAQDGGSQEKKDEKPFGVIGKENATRILLRLLSGGPKDQLELRSFFQQNYQQQHQQQGQHHGSFANFGSPSPLKQRSHNGMMNLGYHTPNNRGNASNSNEPNLELTMLEYYLFLFVRFPLANTFWEMQLRQRRVGNRIASPYGQRVYSHLFSSYLNYYLAQGRVYEVTRLGVGVDCFDSTSTASTANSMSTAVNSTTALDRTSELFLRLLIEFWIEGPNVAPTTKDAIARYRGVRAGVSSSQSVINPSLRDSLELARPFNQSFNSPPSQVQNGVLSLVRHLVSDKSLRELVQSVSGCVQQRQREDRRGDSTPTLINDNDTDRNTPQSNNNQVGVVPWCLTPAMTATQPSLFNYIRLGLACGVIHDRSSIFHWALETWLVWLEPWNYVMKRRAVAATRSGSGNVGSNGAHRAGEFLRNAAATVSSHHRVEYYPSYVLPKPTSPSTFTSQWEAYVVSNAHFYTVPLAIFLKRARELDFSSNVEYPRSLALIQRVLRIYSKPVVNVLNSVLNQRADVLSTSLFARHGSNMRAFCPPNAWKLVECQLDVTSLLEEVFSQYQKRRAGMDLFDRIDAKLNALFDGKIGSQEAALENLLSQVRYLVNLPLDYQVLPDEPRATRRFGLWRLLGLGTKDTTTTGAISENLLVPERGADGKLTDLGRQQIYAGLRKCNPMDVHYIGDPMLARVKSYEIPVLVELTICASKYLNAKLGLVASTPEGDVVGGTEDNALLKQFREMEEYQKVVFRFNFRFLADSRNIIFAAIIWGLVRTIGGFFTN